MADPKLSGRCASDDDVEDDDDEIGDENKVGLDGKGFINASVSPLPLLTPPLLLIAVVLLDAGLSKSRDDFCKNETETF